MSKPVTAPYFLFELTPRCNFDCLYCYNIWKTGGQSAPRELSLDEIRRLFDRILSEVTPSGITLTGGEPLLHPQFRQVVEYLSSRHIPLALTSNGVLLDKDTLRFLSRQGLIYLEISLDSLRPDTLSRLGQDPSQLPRIRQAVLEARSAGIRLNISVIMTRLNQPDIGEVLDFAFAAGAETVSLNRFVPGGLGLSHREKLALTLPELADTLRAADRKAEEYGLSVGLTVPVEDCLLPQQNFPHLRFGTCVCGEYKWMIGPDGELRTCEQNPSSLGSLFRQSFGKLRATLPVDEFRHRNRTKNCFACVSFSSCGGGCRFLLDSNLENS